MSAAKEETGVQPELPPLLSIDLDGPMAYREWDGPRETTFVLIHGLGGSGVNWVRVAPGLSGLGRVLAPDLPGFGSSHRTGRDTGVMSLRRFLSRFLADRATGQVILCGNSMGGAISILQAAIEPDSAQGLVLTASAFPPAAGGRPHPLAIAAFSLYRTPGLGERVMKTRLRNLDPDLIVRQGLRFAAADAASIPPDVVAMQVDAARERQTDPEAVTAFLQAARSLLRLGARPDVAARAMDAVRCPVLVMHGRRDRLVPVSAARAELAAHPSWRGRIFPDLGHVPMLEAPGRWLGEVADWHALVRA
jgi:pimeloyl-ACP methyl ester carboxylesterase